MKFGLMLIAALTITLGTYAADPSAGGSATGASEQREGAASAACQRELRKIDFDNVLREIADARTSGDAQKMRAALDSAERHFATLKGLAVSGSSSSPGVKNTSQDRGAVQQPSTGVGGRTGAGQSGSSAGGASSTGVGGRAGAGTSGTDSNDGSGTSR